MDGFMADCNICIADAMAIQQFCTKPSIHVSQAFGMMEFKDLSGLQLDPDL